MPLSFNSCLVIFDSGGIRHARRQSRRRMGLGIKYGSVPFLPFDPLETRALQEGTRVQSTRYKVLLMSGVEYSGKRQFFFGGNYWARACVHARHKHKPSTRYLVPINVQEREEKQSTFHLPTQPLTRWLAGWLAAFRRAPFHLTYQKKTQKKHTKKKKKTKLEANNSIIFLFF